MSHIGKEELIRIFRAAKHTPILAISEHLEAQEKLNLFHAGIDFFLEKPINADVCAAQANALIKLYLKSDKDLARSVPVAFGDVLYL